ncbi:unnamed protein product [Cyclocybe aegerita]|uniref:MutL C-terminal dimerisation domain-containing protein n=1 Tax=Cyclocybe aegerita TaxID=1973307 RepID=A0A8S0VTE3_CYCAE|nr:unnamed protein product [Cyclocybe aegerita]
MSEPQRTIARLPPPTQAKLRSTQILTSLPQILSELVQNSLDAEATHVDVGIDAKEWICWVRDDGRGISKADLDFLGRGEEGARYNTSKTCAPGDTNSLSTFGFRGEALASAADVSCLEICSRTLKSRNTWSIILKGGKQLYIGPAVRWKRETPGTVVSIRDAFYNLPVRRLSHPNPLRTWELVRQEIETYSLMFPHVSFTIEGTSNTWEAHHKDRTIRIPKNSSTLQSFRHLFGNALTEYVEAIDVALGSMKLEGFISLTGAASKAYQFFYINRHPVEVSDLRRVIDSQFASSSFGKNALDEEGEKNLPRSTIRRSPRKNEKKPVYVLNLSITPEEVDNCFDPSKSIIQLQKKTNVTSFLSTTIQHFLEKHAFISCSNGEPFGGTTTSRHSPRKRKKVDFYAVDDSGYAEQNSISELSKLSVEDDKPEVASGDFYTSTDGPDEVTWLDRATGEHFVVNTRTGHSRTTNRSSQVVNEPCHATIVDHGEGRRTLRQHKTNNSAVVDASARQDPLPKWLEQALESNRTYAITENRILSVQVPLATHHVALTNDPFKSRECHRTHNHSTPQWTRIGALHSGFENPSYRFTKGDLRRADVINQVDRKFIACRIAKRSEAGSQNECGGDVWPQHDYSLVLIDQHAADERVRVEDFLKELCLGFLESPSRMDSREAVGVHVRDVTPPRPVLLTLHEALIIKRSPDVQAMLRKWGVRFVELSRADPVSDSISDSGSCTGYSQLLVSAIPDIVSDKLLQGDELRDFIKGFLGQIQSGELSSDSWDLPSEAAQDEFLWLRAVRSCPKGLLDLINSKACRGKYLLGPSSYVLVFFVATKMDSRLSTRHRCHHVQRLALDRTV